MWDELTISTTLTKKGICAPPHHARKPQLQYILLYSSTSNIHLIIKGQTKNFVNTTTDDTLGIGMVLMLQDEDRDEDVGSVSWASRVLRMQVCTKHAAITRREEAATCQCEPNGHCIVRYQNTLHSKDEYRQT